MTQYQKGDPLGQKQLQAEQFHRSCEQEKVHRPPASHRFCPVGVSAVSGPVWQPHPGLKLHLAMPPRWHVMHRDISNSPL